MAQELTSQQVVELVRSCSGFRPITFGVTSPSQLTELRLALLFPLCCLLTQVRLGAGDGSSQAEAIAAELQNRVDAADFRDLLQTVRSQIDAQDVSDETLTALLVGRYYSDEKTNAAWEGRYQNPKIFQRHVEGLVAELRQQFAPRYDEAATQDREAIASYMRSAGTAKPPERPMRDLSNLSDAEFKRELDRISPDLAERSRL